MRDGKGNEAVFLLNRPHTGIYLPKMVWKDMYDLSRPYLIAWIQNIFSGYPQEAHIEWFAAMNPLTELYCFLLGAVLFVAIKEKKQGMYQTIVFITLVVTALSWYQFVLLFVLFIAAAVLCAPFVRNEKICKWISMAGSASFALYLIHPMVLEVAPAIWGKIGINNRWLCALYLYVLCIGITYILYYGFIIKIEKWAAHKFLEGRLKQDAS